MPSKHAKYGIKVWWVNDSKSFYPSEGQWNTGLDPSGERDIGIRDFCISNFKGTGRNITCDNFFSTVDLAQTLMAHNLSILGTVNQRRRFIHKELLPNKNRALLSSQFCQTDNMVLCSYVPKKNKAVTLLSRSFYRFDS